MTTMLRRLPYFGIGSLVGAAIDYGITLICARFFGLLPALSLGLAMIVSASVVFVFHENITFRKGKKKRLERYGKFMISSAAVFILRAIILTFFISITENIHISLTLAITIVFILNYFMSSRLIFR